MASELIRVRDLRQGDNGNGVCLLCLECHGEYSADAADYFMARPDTIMQCCAVPMVRVSKHTQYRGVAND